MAICVEVPLEAEIRLGFFPNRGILNTVGFIDFAATSIDRCFLARCSLGRVSIRDPFVMKGMVMTRGMRRLASQVVVVFPYFCRTDSGSRDTSKAVFDPWDVSSETALR